LIKIPEFKRFGIGLIMEFRGIPNKFPNQELHVGCSNTPLKTECVFFPPPRFFNSSLPPSLTQDTEEADTANHALKFGNDSTLTNSKQWDEQREKKFREREEALYDGFKETACINVADGRVTFCCHFKYLGC
jgi:hypothetical protein